MGYTVKYVAQIYDDITGDIISEEMLYSKAVIFPKTIDEFGLRHEEQIRIIKESQNSFLAIQTRLLSDMDSCPKCGKKLRKQGVFQSDFHDVFTDHRVSIYRLGCTCGWRNKFTVNGLYGSASHPELIKMQIEKGANNSYKKASNELNKMSCAERKINNDVTIMKQVGKIGEILEDIKKTEAWAHAPKSSEELIVNIDGGHVQHREQGKHSFEEMIATIYDPKDIVATSSGRKEISKKISVASAKQDSQVSIKKLVKNACIKMGMKESTKITVLTDGANNCWSIIKDLEFLCSSLTKILDWFHIGKKFKERKSKIPIEHIELYDKAKWHLWHGHPKTSIIRLNQIKALLTDSVAIGKIDELVNYIENNEGHIVNYHVRRLKKLPYTSQHAETSVNSLINERQKNQKMQWTREGANNILQIRSSMYSMNWEEDWQKAKNQIYNIAASN